MNQSEANKKVQQTVNSKVAIDKSLVETGQYDPSLIIPTNTKIYPRNTVGSMLIDSNIQNINDHRLVVNLTGVQYKKNSFEEIIDISFSEFLDPEIEYEESSEASNTLDQVPGLQQQLAQKDEQIKQLTESLSDLQDSLQGVNQQIQDLNALQNTSQGQSIDDTKGRIFTDGTLLRDRAQQEYFYIIEDGKKRWFWFNNDLALAAAKAFGKVTPSGAIDWIDVSQYILDRIPSGANFEAEDLVKNKKTPAPEPLALPNGQRIISSWVTNQNPIVIRTTKIGKQTNLKIPVSIRFTTDTGKVNKIEIWDHSIPWYETKPQIPIKRSAFDDSDWGKDTITGYWGPDTIDKFDVWIKDTTSKLSGADNNSNVNGINYINRHTDIVVDRNNPVKEIVLVAKVFNDTAGEGYSDKLIVRIELVPDPMPNVIGEKNIDVTAKIRNVGITNDIKLIQGIIAPDDSLINDVYKQSIPAGTTLALSSSDIIELTYYGPRKVTIPEWRYQNWKTIGRYLKDLGFTKINIKYSLSSDEQDHYKIWSFGYNENPLSWTGLNAGQLVDLNTTLAITVYLWRNAKSTVDPRYTYQELDNSLSLRSKILTELYSI